MATTWRPVRLHGGKIGEEFTRLGGYLQTVGPITGVGTAASGTAPLARDGGYSQQWDNAAVTTDGAGAATITFPTAFPSGVAVVICRFATGTYTTAGFAISGGPLSTAITVPYLAIGF